MKKNIIILSIAILLANVTLGQAKKNVSVICDTTKKNVFADLKVNGGVISLDIKVGKYKLGNMVLVEENKYMLSLTIPTDKPDVSIKNSTIFKITMQDDSTLIYFTKGTAVPEFSTYSKQYEYLLILEGNYKDEQWNHLVSKRIKSIRNLTGNDFLINPSESKKLLADIKCYAKNLKK